MEPYTREELIGRTFTHVASNIKYKINTHTNADDVYVTWNNGANGVSYSLMSVNNAINTGSWKLDDKPTVSNSWRKIKRAQYARFQLGVEPEVIHIIKTGFKDEYFVVSECGAETIEHGKLIIMTAEAIQKNYGINIEEGLYYV